MNMSKIGVMNQQILNSKVRFIESRRAVVSRLNNFIKKSLIEKAELPIVQNCRFKGDFLKPLSKFLFYNQPYNVD